MACRHSPLVHPSYLTSGPTHPNNLLSRKVVYFLLIYTTRRKNVPLIWIERPRNQYPVLVGLVDVYDEMIVSYTLLVWILLYLKKGIVPAGCKENWKFDWASSVGSSMCRLLSTSSSFDPLLCCIHQELFSALPLYLCLCASFQFY